MEIMHGLLAPLLSEEAIRILYFFSGALISCFYVPQVVRLLRDTTGAAAISLFAWAGWTILRVPALLYAVLIPKDWVMFCVVMLDVIGRLTVLSISCYKRYRFNLATGERTGLSVVDVDSRIMIKMKREVIEQNSKLSSSYQGSTKAMLEIREKEEKTKRKMQQEQEQDNTSLETYIETEPLEQENDNTVVQNVSIGHPWYKKKK